MKSKKGFRFMVSESQRLLPDSELRFAEIFHHGTLNIEIYAPRGRDPQQPHNRDEVYVVVSASGVFQHGVHEESFGPGDLFFVPAGLPHRFKDFTEDFVTWVLFYGPEGGENDGS